MPAAIKNINKQSLGLILLAIIIYLCQAIPNATKAKIESDQNDYINYATRLLKGNSTRLMNYNDCSCMPIMVLVVIPRVVQQILQPGLVKTDGGLSDINNGRRMMVLLGMCILILFFIFLQTHFNNSTALVGIFLLAISPGFIAQTTVVKTDAFAMASFLLVLHFLFAFLKSNSLKHFVILACSIAVAQHCKTFMLHLYILFVVWYPIFCFVKHWKFSKAIGYLILFGLIQLIIINAGFLFNGFMVSKSQIVFTTNLFIGLQHNIIGNFILQVLPTPFVMGLDQIIYMDTYMVGHGHNCSYTYFNYTIYYQKGKPYYFFLVTMFFKTPIVIFLAFLFSLYLLIKNKLYLDYRFKIIAILGIYFILYFCFLLNTKVCVHYTLFICLLFYTVIAFAIATYCSLRVQKYFWCFFACTFLFNTYYFNERAAGYINELLVFNNKKHFILGPTFFCDPFDKEKFIALQAQYPAYKTPGSAKESGKFITSTNEVLIKFSNAARPNWLLNYKPEKIIDDGYLLYTIP